MSAPETGSLEHLMCDLLQRYCEEQQLPLASADDILILHRETLTEQQRRWLSCYIQLWDESIFEPAVKDPPVDLDDTDLHGSDADSLYEPEDEEHEHD